MGRLDPVRRRRRARVERVLRVVHPFFDLVLALGERLSRTVSRDEDGWVAPRPLDAESREALTSRTHQRAP